MSETEKITLIFEAAKFIAGLWKRVFMPVEFDRVINVEGVDVRVHVSAAQSVSDDPGRKTESALEIMQAETEADR